MKALKTLILILLVSCGVDPNALTEQQKQQEQQQQPLQPTSKLTSSDFLLLEGYVSPINITVNNKAYRDSEDFYTQEVDRLTIDVHEKYPGYDLFFDADIGLQDFKLGLLVFLVASSDSGVASESAVDSKGKFTFSLPSNVNKQDLYTLRASKRIGLRLVKDKQTISWCYNLFAENDSVIVDGKSIILRKWETNITNYKCTENKQDQITLPDNPYNYVVEAFETADTYNGYGPLPKKTNAAPVVKAEEETQAGNEETQSGNVLDSVN